MFDLEYKIFYYYVFGFLLNIIKVCFNASRDFKILNFNDVLEESLYVFFRWFLFGVVKRKFLILIYFLINFRIVRFFFF